VSLKEFLSLVTSALERAQVPYMLTGSVASSAFASPRSTRDIDIVVDPTAGQLRALILEFPRDRYYADQQQAIQALENRSQFNVIDPVTGWKADFIISKQSTYDQTALARRMAMEIAGTLTYVSTPEDVVIAKLRWAKLAESERQIQDVRGILSVQGQKLDFVYMERWIAELDLEGEWRSARR
jgi:hypothetical protein